MGAYLLQHATANVTYGGVIEASYGLSICTLMTSGPYRVWFRVSYSCLSFVPSSVPSSGMFSAFEALLAGSDSGYY